MTQKKEERCQKKQFVALTRSNKSFLDCNFSLLFALCNKFVLLRCIFSDIAEEDGDEVEGAENLKEMRNDSSMAIQKHLDSLVHIVSAVRSSVNYYAQMCI